jgi:hypothetical protein
MKETETAVCRWCGGSGRIPVMDIDDLVVTKELPCPKCSQKALAPCSECGERDWPRYCGYRKCPRQGPAPAVPEDPVCVKSTRHNEDCIKRNAKCLTQAPADLPIPRVERLEKALREMLEMPRGTSGRIIIERGDEKRLRVLLEGK